MNMPGGNKSFMRPYSRVYATVNLDAVASNMKSMRDNLPAATLIMGSVKADGYGHGSVPVAKAIAGPPLSDSPHPMFFPRSDIPSRT